MVTPLQSSRYAVDVVALTGDITFTKTVMVPHGQTLGWAVNASGLYAAHAVLQGNAIGVWGKVLPPETLVNEGDRIEVYQAVAPATITAHRQRLQALRDTKNNGKVPA